MNIYVGNLAYDATDETIRKAFESFGQGSSIRIIKDKNTGQSQAQTAIRSLNGKELLGKEMKVSEARPRASERRTEGGRMEYSRRRNRY